MKQRFKSDNPSVTKMIAKAESENVETVFDRYQEQQPQCGFGTLGLCCRICWKGPCRIDPFGTGPQRGICGADQHTIVARQLARMIAAGASAHSDHGRHILYALHKMTNGGISELYEIKDEAKLLRTAKRMGIATNDRAVMDVLKDVVAKTYEDFGNQEASKVMNWLKFSLPQKRLDLFEKLNLLPTNIDMAVAQTVSRTHIGCDADPTNIILGGISAALADFCGMTLATELSDIMFGTPTPVYSEADLGVINENAVNIAVNGHNPLVAEAVCSVAESMQEQARALGARDGINIVGVCCTGNEALMRHGVSMAANYLSQEMVMVTGAIDAMVVDVQCIMPGITNVADNFHTAVITTHDENKIPGAIHKSVHPENAREAANEIIQLALNRYTLRNPAHIMIPKGKETCIVGFSTEAILEVLTRINAEDPLKPLIDAIVKGDIKGVALFAGCNTTQIDQDKNFKTLGRELAKRDVLLLATGCGGGAFAKDGLMTQEAVEKFAGPGLKGVLTSLGEAAGLNGPLPLVFHMGSCVDNSRAVMLTTALAEKLGVDLGDLPVVASAPEAMAEKAVAIGSWSVALGFPTHLGNIPQIMGSDQVVELVTNTTKEIFGGYFLVDPDPESAADKLYEAILERRKGLGI